MSTVKATFLLGIFFCATFMPTEVLCRRLHFDTATSSFNPKYFSNFTIDIANGAVGLDMYVVTKIVEGLRTTLDFKMRTTPKAKYRNLFSYNVDACNVITSAKQSIMKKWFRSIKQYGNFLDRCPVFVGHYYINGWNLDQTLVPTFFIPGEYRVDVHAYYGKLQTSTEEFIVHMELTGRIV